MKFENLYTPRVDQMLEADLTAFIRDYRKRRAEDITPVAVDIPIKGLKAKLSSEELALLKSVGITARMLKSLRTEVEDEDDRELFTE